MEKETTYKISLSKYYEQFQTGNGEIDAPEITEQLQNEINECIKDAAVVAINGVNMSRLDHQPIVASIEEDSFGDWLFGINFKLGASADGLYIIDIRTAWWIEINVRDEGRLAIIKVHDDKQGEGKEKEPDIDKITKKMYELISEAERNYNRR